MATDMPSAVPTDVTAEVPAAFAVDVEPLRAEATLRLWEAAFGQPPWTRDELLLRAAGAQSTPRTLGARNAALMRLHASWFGARLELLSTCAHCGTTIEFAADCEALAPQLDGAPPAAPQALDLDGHRIEFRVPDVEAVVLASTAGPQPTTGFDPGLDPDPDFAERLWSVCVLSAARDGQPCRTADLPEPVRRAVTERMEALDPGASISFALDCPGCAARWQAPFDIGLALWRKLQEQAERLLIDVDTLARAYGWAQHEVLALSPLRRAAYLQLVRA